MLRACVLSLAVVMALGTSGLAAELAPPVRLEAGGKPIDTDVGHAAPWVADVDGDGIQDLLVGDYTRQKPDRPEPTPEEEAEYARIRKELEPLRERSGELMQQVYGRERVRDKEKREQITEEMERIHARMRELRDKLPPEYETHGWVWLFLRTK